MDLHTFCDGKMKLDIGIKLIPKPMELSITVSAISIDGQANRLISKFLAATIPV